MRRGVARITSEPQPAYSQMTVIASGWLSHEGVALVTGTLDRVQKRRRSRPRMTGPDLKNRHRRACGNREARDVIQPTGSAKLSGRSKGAFENVSPVWFLGVDAMASCEKCWRDSGGDPTEYSRLIKARTGTANQCTPEDQAGGVYATGCPTCCRQTVHCITGKCVNPKCAGRSEPQ